MSDEEINPYKMPAYEAPKVVEEDIATTDLQKESDHATEELLSRLGAEEIVITDAGGERRAITYVPNKGDMTAAQFAMQIVAAEEGARITAKAIDSSLWQLARSISSANKYPEPSLAISPETPSDVRFLTQSRKEKLEDYVVNGSYRFLGVFGAGRITDVYISSASSSYSVSLIVDEDVWYDNSYTNLTATSVADSHLAAYQDAVTSKYIVKFSDIKFISGFEALIKGDSITFDVLRGNYEVIVAV